MLYGTSLINIILPKVLYFHMSIFRPEGLERDYELPKLVHLITTTEPYQFERIPINTILHITHTEKVVQKKRKGKNLDTIPMAYPIVSHVSLLWHHPSCWPLVDGPLCRGCPCWPSTSPLPFLVQHNHLLSHQGCHKCPGNRFSLRRNLCSHGCGTGPSEHTNDNLSPILSPYWSCAGTNAWDSLYWNLCNALSALDP